MTYRTTDEIDPKLTREQYQEKLAAHVREIANAIETKNGSLELEPDEELSLWVMEYLAEERDLCLSYPFSVIKHSKMTLSVRGASRLGEVISAEDFAQEHARDLLEQEIESELEAILDGATIEDVTENKSERATERATESQDFVSVSEKTAKQAVRILTHHFEFADTGIDRQGVEDAIGELETQLQKPLARTQVLADDYQEEVVIPGVPRGTFQIDYMRSHPKLVLQTNDDRVIEPVIGLPSDNQPAESTQKPSSANSGDA